MFKYDMCISRLGFRICSPEPVLIPENFKPFVVENLPEESINVTLEIFPGFGDVSTEPQGIRLARNVFRQGDQILQRYHWRDDQYFVRYEPVGRDLPCRLAIPTDFFEAFCSNGNWLIYMALERLLLPYDRIIIHASAVIWQGKAYLFCAPSGGGKSTQAALWQQEGAEILNGDKVILGRENGEWVAYGSPVAGSSGIYRNESAPVAAIMLVQKHSENQLKRVSKRTAFLSLYSGCVKSDWDQDFNCRLLDILEELTEHIPVCQLNCTPTKEAVDCVRSNLKG